MSVKEVRSSNFHELQHGLGTDQVSLASPVPTEARGEEMALAPLPRTTAESPRTTPSAPSPTALGAPPSPFNRRGNWGLLGSRPLRGGGSRPAGLSPATRVGHPSPLCGARKRSVRLRRPLSFPPGRLPEDARQLQVQEKAARRSCNPALQQAGFQPAQALLGAANGRAVPSDHSQSEGSRPLRSRRATPAAPPCADPWDLREVLAEQRVLAGIGWRLGVRGADWPPRMDRFRVRLGWPEREFPGCAGLPVGLEQSQGATASWLWNACARLQGGITNEEWWWGRRVQSLRCENP